MNALRAPWGAEPIEIPDYVSPEEGQFDPVAIEARLDAYLASRGGVLRA